MENELKTIVTDFINTLQSRSSAKDLLRFYHPDIEQVEFPNAITKTMAVRNLNDMQAGAEKGKKVLLKEELAVSLGGIPVGGQMKAYFAQFYEIMGGKIIRMRNYDCFEPF